MQLQLAQSPNIHLPIPPQQRIGLVAGWGSFPLEIAEKCVADGAELYVVGIRGHADPALKKLATEFRWMGVARLGGHIRFFQQHQVAHVALAGKLFKDRLLYHGLGWIGLVPDLTCMRTLAPIFWTRQADARDDSILGSIVQAYEKTGIEIISIEDLAPKLLISSGVIVGTTPAADRWADIRFGWQVAREMGRLDIGQSITIKDQLVLAVEAIEGTDALISRTGKLCPRGGFTLVKAAKPQQDMRFDVPTIGPRTVSQMASAGGRLIVCEAGRTILVERDETIATAQRLGVTIVALSDVEAQQLPSKQHQPAA